MLTWRPISKRDQACQTYNSLQEQSTAVSQSLFNAESPHQNLAPHLTSLSNTQSSGVNHSVTLCLPKSPETRSTGPDHTVPKNILESEITIGAPSSNDADQAVHQDESDEDGTMREVCLHPAGPFTHNPVPAGYMDPQTRYSEAAVCRRELRPYGTEPLAGRSTGFSSCSGALMLTPVTLCGTCSAAFESVACASTNDFWVGIESSKCCEKVWLNFKNNLKDIFQQEFTSNHDHLRSMKMLKKLLNVNEALDVVHISKYLSLVKHIGPIRIEENRCVSLQQLEDLVSKSYVKDPKRRKKTLCWFAGPMARDEALTKLEGQPPGTFLIRMSETEGEDGSFALSLVMTDSTIEHFRLEGHPDYAIRAEPFSLNLEFRGRRFSSLPELVNDYLRLEEISDEDVQLCVQTCPLIRS